MGICHSSSSFIEIEDYKLIRTENLLELNLNGRHLEIRYDKGGGNIHQVTVNYPSENEAKSMYNTYKKRMHLR